MGSYVNTTLPSDGRILLLPALDSGYYNTKLETLSWGYFSLDLLPRSIIHRGIITNDQGSNQLVDGLYDSIVRDDRRSFELIASKLDIQYVLWLGDAVYHEEYKDNRSISAQKSALTSWKYPIAYSSGRWTLYKISEENQTPLAVSVADAIQIKGYFQDYSTALTSVIGSNGGIFINDTGNETLRGSSTSANIYQARCVFCDAVSRRNALYGVVVNNLAYAPGSRQFIRYINTINTASEDAKDIPSRIDASLAKADAVLATIKWFNDNHQNASQSIHPIHSCQVYKARTIMCSN